MHCSGGVVPHTADRSQWMAPWLLPDPWGGRSERCNYRLKVNRTICDSLGSVFLGADFFPKVFFCTAGFFPAPCYCGLVLCDVVLCGCFVLFAGVHNDATPIVCWLRGAVLGAWGGRSRWQPIASMMISILSLFWLLTASCVEGDVETFSIVRPN